MIQLITWLRKITSSKEAANALSWVELACTGEEYSGDGFKLKCI